jgi:hypothetical protein
LIHSGFGLSNEDAAGFLVKYKFSLPFLLLTAIVIFFEAANSLLNSLKASGSASKKVILHHTYPH